MNIERGVPIPHDHRWNYSKWHDVCCEMDKDDSVIVENLGEAKSLCYVLRYHGHKATQRKQTDGTYRVWKV